MKILEFNGFIEVGVPKNYYKFLSQHGLYNHFGIEVNNALNKIKHINGHSIYKTKFSQFEDNCKINNFNYSNANLCKKSKKYNVYRFFGFTGIAVQADNCNDIFVNDLMIDHKTMRGILKINIIICGYGCYTSR